MHQWWANLKSNFTVKSQIIEQHTHSHNRFTSLWNLSGTTRVRRYQKKHSPTHTHHGHQSSQSAFSIYYDPWHPPYSIHVLYSLFPQSLSIIEQIDLNLNFFYQISNLSKPYLKPSLKYSVKIWCCIQIVLITLTLTLLTLLTVTVTWHKHNTHNTHVINDCQVTVVW